MADNVDITEGAGKTIATDDVGGSQYQRIKLSDGTADSSDVVATDIGTKTNALRVAPASDITDATYIGDIKFGEAEPNSGDIKTAVEAIQTSVELIDNAVDGNYLNINMNLAGTDAQAGEGIITASTQRVTLATDDDIVAYLATIAGAVAGSEMQVDVVASLPSGTNAIGKLAANSGVDIGDVDVTSVPAPLNVVGGGTEAVALRVTIANDSTGVVSIDDNGGSITVDGTVTANLSATDNTVLDNIDTATTASQTALEIIDDWDAVHDSAASSDGVQLMAAYDSTKPTAVGDGDAVRVLADEYGRLLSGVEKTVWSAVYDSADASGEGEVVKASAPSTIVVLQSYIISSDVEQWIKLQDEDSTALTGKFWLKAGGGVAITLPDKAPIVLGADKDLEVISETSGNVSVSATGYTIPG